MLTPGQAAEPAPLQLRAQQQRMVDAILAAWNAGESIAIEAPTGTGKTYAYLMAALAQGGRFVVSTATRALQDQLVDRDLPALLGHLQMRRRVAVLKGRENYVCLHGLAQSLQTHRPADQLQALQQVARWAQGTRSGDLAELDDLRELPALLPQITASHSECLGQRCTHFAACFSNRARAQAAQADVLVINHHLYFSELRHRQMLGAAHGFVPLAETVVMDEAHQLPAIGLKVLAKGLNAGDVQDFLQSAARQTRMHARGFAPWDALLASCSQALVHWLAVSNANSGGPGSEAGRAEAAAGESTEALVRLHNRLSEMIAALQGVAGGAASLQRLVEQGHSLLATLRQWGRPPAAGLVRWWDGPSLPPQQSVPRAAPAAQARALRQGFRESPPWLWQALAALQPDVLGATWLAAPMTGVTTPSQAAVPQRWLFTSATLGQDDALQWFTSAMGLQGLAADRAPLLDGVAALSESQTQAQLPPQLSPQVPSQVHCLRLAHALDWAAQAALVIPQSLPPADAPATERAQALAAWLKAPVEQLGGRCMVLCTSTQAMWALAAALRHELGGTPIDVQMQGEAPKRHLLAGMRGATGQGRRGQVLVGTMALWEGVDLPGEALQLLVIDKLPFPPRHDALHAARAAALQDLGEDGFLGYTLPQTAMQLRQGVGRLLRSFSDRGLVVIADARLCTRSYGASLLAALPPMPQLPQEEVARYLASIREIRVESTDASQATISSS